MSTNAIPCPKTNLAVSSTEHCQSLFNESQIWIRLGSRCGQRVMIPLEQEFSRCKDYQTLFLPHDNQMPLPSAGQVLLDFSLAVCYRCSTQDDSLLSGSSPIVKWSHHCCVADKSALNLSKPTWDSVLVFTISLAKARL